MTDPSPSLAPMEYLIGSAFVLSAFYVFDKMYYGPATTMLVERPLHSLYVRNEEVAAPAIYLSPRNRRNEFVYIMYTGNPGIPDFYIETMLEVDRVSQSTMDVYVLGNAGQADICKQTVDRNTPLHKLPRVNTAEYTAPCANPSAVFDLYDQTLFKLQMLVQIHKRHEHSKLIISCNSMGGFLLHETLRNLERAYVLMHYGTEALSQYDMGMKLSISEVESDTNDFGANITLLHPNVGELQDVVSQVLLSKEHLEQVFSLIKHAPAPKHGMTANPGYLFNFDTSHATDLIVSAQFFMPTIHRIANTESGVKLMKQVGMLGSASNLVTLTSFIMRVVPSVLKRLLSYSQGRPTKYPFVSCGAQLMQTEPNMRNVLSLGYDEMINIRGLDTKLFQRMAYKTFIYYAEEDHWVSPDLRQYVMDLATKWKAMGWDAPRIEITEIGMKHAFCYDTPKEMAQVSLSQVQWQK